MNNDYSERVCFCTLNRVFGFRPDIAHGIVETLGSASAIFKMDKYDLDQQLGPYSKITPFINDAELETTDAELRRLDSLGYQFITMADECFPKLLLECPDSPLGLYYKSSTPPEEVFNKRKQIAVVGTRDISLYGREWCHRIVEAISKSGSRPMIVSGFALGTDIIAHLTALDCGLPTVAVLPTGIDSSYPPQNRRFIDRLSSTPGCAFVTDYPPDTTPKAINFIRRNRIIAGMCGSTILVESKAKGGGMITARLAASYNRDVFILPGRIDDPRSQGCNQLLQEKLAEPITDIESFLASLGIGDATPAKARNIANEVREAFSSLLTEEELRDMLTIVATVKKNRGVSIDELCGICGMSYSKVARHTGMLESEGFMTMDLLQRCAIRY